MAAPRVFLLLLLMTISFSSAKALLRCSQQAEAIEVVSGSWVLLPCLFNWTGALPESRHNVWQKVVQGSNDPVVQTSNPQAQKTQDRMYVGRTTVSANWFEKREASLNMTGVSLNDTGVYTCSVITRRPDFSSTCATITLTVTDAAVAVIGPAVLLLIGLGFTSFLS